MPQMGGRELAARLTALRPETRVLYVSGYADDATPRPGAAESGAAFLEKPFTAASLAAKVRAVLDAAGREGR
jgi:DNA-binding response OmpR family regulator